jgi:hypothetical protein
LNAAGAGRWKVSETQLRRHRNVAGYSISDPQDPRTINLFRYAAWLTLEFAVAKVPLVSATPGNSEGENPETPRSPGGGGDNSGGAYDRHRSRTAQKQREISRDRRELGDLPPIADPQRRESCRLDYKRFCRTYLPHVFTLEWAEPHLLAGNQIEAVVLDGGLFALAMPRGWGKTSLCLAGAIWALFYGHRRFVVYIGAAGEEADARLVEVKTELETNDLLAADFPEICIPIRALEGISQRARAQTYQGQRTRIRWEDDHLVLPTIPGSSASGSVILSRGITGALRGMRHTTADQRVIRPDLAVVDDPQTDESADSPSQCAKRLRTINSSVLQLAGPTQRIAVFLPLTVIQKDDLADQLLDRERNPHFQGQRTAALKQLPTGDRVWDEYREARAEGLRRGDKGKSANAFFEKHRKKLYEGAELVWPDYVKDGDVDPLQSIMHVKLDDELSFWAELMQQPLTGDEDSEEKLDLNLLATRIAAPKPGVVPQAMPTLTAFIDANSKALWWVVCAFGQDASSHIVAHGIWPEQTSHYYTHRELKRTIARMLPGAGRPAQLLHALEQLTGDLLTREWPNEGGEPVRIRRCLVDANWGEMTTVLYQFCRQSVHAPILMPSHGHFVGPGQQAIEDWAKQPGDRVGQHWRERYSKTHASRFVIFDSNRWKSTIASRLRVPRGDRGALTFFEQSRERHRLLMDHILSEKPSLDDKKGRSLLLWKQTKGRDNDLFDGIVGCAVAASMEGINEPGSLVTPSRRVKPAKKLQDIYRERFG